MKCTDILTEEHKIILRALDVLEQMAARTEKDQPVAPEDVQTLLHFLRVFADDHHQVKEESALFPELMRTSLANDVRLRQMTFEHDQERSLVEGLEDALRTKKGSDFVHFANWLALLIRTHIHKEDNILFELAQRLLLPEQDERITAELNKFQVDRGIVAGLERLERAYSKRVA
jgi:hemerythrin-like domain-containing protein